MLSRAYQNNSLPRWAYFFLAALCACMGIWASYITLQYFEHGAKALETDTALQALAVSAAVMFVASEMGAFALAALLTERQLRARRWSLSGFAAAVLALEVCTIVAVQMALTSGADLTQTTVQTQEKDLRARIAAIEADAAAKRATADQQRAAAKNAYELHLAGKSGDRAAAEQAKTAPLYDELAKVQAQKRPTLTGLMGEKTALAYAVARGVLVSLGGLVFFGAAGALLRAGRGGVSVDAQIIELLHEIRSTPAALAALAAPAPAIDAPAAPALASFKPAGVPVVSYGGKAMFAGAGALAAMAAPMAQAAPTVPAAAPVKVDSAAALVTAPNPAHTLAPTAPNPAHSVASTAPESAQKRKARKVQGVQLDTGTSGLGAARYNRIKAAVKAGKLTPSTRAIQAAEGGSGDVVRAYLQQLEKDGVTVRKGRGYVLAK